MCVEVLILYIRGQRTSIQVNGGCYVAILVCSVYGSGCEISSAVNIWFTTSPSPLYAIAHMLP